MKKLILTTTAIAALGTMAFAEEVNIGIALGFTGPIETMAVPMKDGAQLAFDEVNAAGGINGAQIVVKTADTTCIDVAAATAAVEGLVNNDNIAALVGPACSGTTTAVVNNISAVTGLVTISSSATSPALSEIEDKGYFFRTAPSDARQGEVLAGIVYGKGHKNVAITYTNNDYGKGFSEAFSKAFEALGGTITINASHDDGKGDYSAEIGALQAAGGDALVVLGYADQGGKGIIQAALDSGAFSVFAMGDGMHNAAFPGLIGSGLDGSYGTLPSAQGESKDAFLAAAEAAGIDGTGIFAPESYDAAALIALAAAAAGSNDRAAIQTKILDVANAPGEKINAGDLARGLELLAAGEDIDYVGATNVELVGPGEASGTYLEYEIVGGEYKDVAYH